MEAEADIQVSMKDAELGKEQHSTSNGSGGGS